MGIQKIGVDANGDPIVENTPLKEGEEAEKGSHDPGPVVEHTGEVKEHQ